MGCRWRREKGVDINSLLYLLLGHVDSCHITSRTNQLAENKAVQPRPRSQVQHLAAFNSLGINSSTAVVPRTEFRVTSHLYLYSHHCVYLQIPVHVMDGHLATASSRPQLLVVNTVSALMAALKVPCICHPLTLIGFHAGRALEGFGMHSEFKNSD